MDLNLAGVLLSFRWRWQWVNSVDWGEQEEVGVLMRLRILKIRSSEYFFEFYAWFTHPNCRSLWPWRKPVNSLTRRTELEVELGIRLRKLTVCLSTRFVAAFMPMTKRFASNLAMHSAAATAMRLCGQYKTTGKVNLQPGEVQNLMGAAMSLLSK